jgi:hypothetical protein
LVDGVLWPCRRGTGNFWVAPADGKMVATLVLNDLCLEMTDASEPGQDTLRYEPYQGFSVFGDEAPETVEEARLSTKTAQLRQIVSSSRA